MSFGPGNPIVNMIRPSANQKEHVMFMIVTYPWPVASAHVELTGPQTQDPAVIDASAVDDTMPEYRAAREIPAQMAEARES
jgi:hypothetical protein